MGFGLLRTLSKLGVVTALCLLSSRVSASGFSVGRFSGEHGNPTTDNPTALYHNPAALRGDRAELFVDGLIGYRRMTYTRTRQASDADDVPGAEGANVGRATLSNVVANPSIWLKLPVSERLVLAAGAFTAVGGPIDWDTRSEFEDSRYPGPFDGVSRYHATEGWLSTSTLSLGASYGVTHTLRLGVAVNALYSRVDDVRAWGSGGNDVAHEGRSLLEVDGWSWGFAAGIFYECSCKRLRLGLSYQSRPNVSGGMELDGALSNDIGGPSSADVALHQDLPDIARAGVAYQPEQNIELRLFGAWERWSAFDKQCVTESGEECSIRADGSQPNGGHVLQNIPRDFHDAFEARAGVSVWTSPSLELFSGIGVMSQAVPDTTLEAGLPDFVGVTFSLGAKKELSDTFTVAGSLSHIVSPARDVDSSSLDSYELPSKLPSANGHYAQSLSYADVNVSVKF
jgi:long-chain fatty acid transport protein